MSVLILDYNQQSISADRIASFDGTPSDTLGKAVDYIHTRWLNEHRNNATGNGTPLIIQLHSKTLVEEVDAGTRSYPTLLIQRKPNNSYTIFLGDNIECYHLMLHDVQ